MNRAVTPTPPCTIRTLVIVDSEGRILMDPSNAEFDYENTLEQIIEEEKYDVPSSYYTCSIILKDNNDDRRTTLIPVDNHTPLGELIHQHIPQNRDIENCKCLTHNASPRNLYPGRREQQLTQCCLTIRMDIDYSKATDLHPFFKKVSWRYRHIYWLSQQGYDLEYSGSSEGTTQELLEYWTKELDVRILRNG